MASKKISEIATTSYFANTDIIPLVRTVSSTKTTYVATISALFGSVDADAHFHGAFSANNGGVFSGNTFHANTDSVQLDGNTTIQHLEIANSYFGLANTYTPANSTFVPHSTGVWMFMDSDAIYVAETGVIKKSTLQHFLLPSDPVQVSLLPSASVVGAGAKAFVTDATVTTFASVVVGGGSNKVPVYSDGTQWLIG